MPVAELTQLRLPAFKSVRNAVIPINELTLILGRNGSGKSNIIDGLAVLSALAEGGDLRDALDGGRAGPVVRGGSEGCAPLGSSSFELGCTVSYDGVEYHLDLVIQVSPTLEIRSERLWTVRRSGQRRGEPIDYLKSDPPDPHSADLQVRWHNDRRGVNPAITMRASQLVTSQASTRVPATSAAGRKVHEVADIVLSGISGIFILDPDPHQMREYVPERDNVLRRNAENLSATLKRLSEELGGPGHAVRDDRVVIGSAGLGSDVGDQPTWRRHGDNRGVDRGSAAEDLGAVDERWDVAVPGDRGGNAGQACGVGERDHQWPSAGG